MELPGKIKIITFANKKYNSCRSFIFTENDLVNLKIRDKLKLIEKDAARIIFKTSDCLKTNIKLLIEFVAIL